MDIMFNKIKSINVRGKLMDLSKPKVMGILNITPDSFFDGGKFIVLKNAEERIDKMIDQGADIIDIGAVSTRPGAELPDLKTEMKRLLPVLDLITKKYESYVFSLDTFRSEIAKEAVKNYNVSIINDISAGNLDSEMFNTVAELNVPYIIMHMQGTPATMQKNPEYKDVVMEIMKFFVDKVSDLKRLGVHDILIDPGFGFGKTLDHNYTLLKHLDDFKILDLPVVTGLSRKSMINKLLGIRPEEALNGTCVLNTISIINGANILRVHDVKEAKEVINICQKLQKS